MSIGKNRHYSIDNIMPRHFLQTAELAGVGAPLVHRVFADLAETAVRRTDDVIAALPQDFPDELVTAVRTAVRERARLLADQAGVTTDA